MKKLRSYSWVVKSADSFKTYRSDRSYRRYARNLQTSVLLFNVMKLFKVLFGLGETADIERAGISHDTMKQSFLSVGSQIRVRLFSCLDCPSHVSRNDQFTWKSQWHTG